MQPGEQVSETLLTFSATNFASLFAACGAVQGELHRGAQPEHQALRVLLPRGGCPRLHAASAVPNPQDRKFLHAKILQALMPDILNYLHILDSIVKNVQGNYIVAF
jgi:hypothetical protein